MAELPQPGGSQRSQQKFVIFENFEKLNTQAARQGLSEKQLAWLENLQPIAENNLVTVPAVAAAALATLTETASLIYYAAINTVDYFIVFTTAGAAFAVNIATGNVARITADGTFSTSPDMTTWQASRILIADPIAGYSTWDGTVFSRQGGVSPNIVVTNGGSGYSSPPPITISGGSGSGATAVATAQNGVVVSIQLTNPGAGYKPTDALTVTIGTGVGSGATGHAVMSGSSVQSVSVLDGGALQPTTNPPGTYGVSFAGGGGAGAQANATIGGVPNRVLSINMITNGAGYSSQPTVTVLGLNFSGGGRGPTLSPIMSTQTVTSLVRDTGGTGYITPPTVTLTTIQAGEVAATGHATLSGSSVSSLVLDTPGTYLNGDTPSVIIGTGSGAAASAHVWPFVPNPSTVAVFQGRVWLGDGTNPQLLQWTGTGASYGNVGYDDFLSADASGSLLITDADLIHQITALRSLNNYLFIVGDNSIKQIGSISLNAAGTVTLFTILTLSSDQGTIYRNSCISYNRVFLFVSPNGVYGVFGTSVQKISSDLDGIFKNVDFTLPPQGALVDLNRIHNACFLLRYNDPASTLRTILIIFDGKKWWVASQGNSLVAIASAETLTTDLNNVYGSSGTDITELFGNAAGNVNWKLQTSLTHHGNALQGKRILEVAITSNAQGGQVNVSVDVDNTSLARVLNLPTGFGMVCVNNDANGNAVGQSGVYLGLTFTGTGQKFTFTTGGIIYQEGTLGKPT